METLIPIPSSYFSPFFSLSPPSLLLVEPEFQLLRGPLPSFPSFHPFQFLDPSGGFLLIIPPSIKELPFVLISNLHPPNKPTITHNTQQPSDAFSLLGFQQGQEKID